MSAEKGGHGAQRLECKIKHTIIDTVLVSTALCYAQLMTVSNSATNTCLGRELFDRCVIWHEMFEIRNRLIVIVFAESIT